MNFPKKVTYFMVIHFAEKGLGDTAFDANSSRVCLLKIKESTHTSFWISPSQHTFKKKYCEMT